MGTKFGLILIFAFSLVVAACGGGDSDTTTTTAALAADTTRTTAAATTTAVPPTTASTVASPTNSSIFATTIGVEIGVVCGHELVAGFAQLDCEGVTFDIATPEVCSVSPCGLIVDVHGDTASGALAEQHTGMQELGNAAGYVVVQPNAPGPIWDHEVDDGLIRAFLERLIEGLKLDRDRVHIGGFSRGGWMTWRFVCNHADLIASAAPAGAGASYPEDQNSPGVSCDFDASGFPSQEVDVLYVHGRSDPDVPFETALLQRDLVISSWDMTEADILVNEPDYRWTRWASPQGPIFEFLEHDWQGGVLGGHCYPGGSGMVGCGTDTAVSYGKAALQFYIDHPKDE